MGRTARISGGFSLVELLIATSLTLVVMAVVFHALHPAQAIFLVEPERGDMQQRLRVATVAISSEARVAGAGSFLGRRSGGLSGYLPSVLPYRQGRRGADSPGTVRSDTITLLRAADGAAQTTLSQRLPARSGSVEVSLDPGCPSGDPACGFATGMTVLVFDDSGRHDLFSVSAIQGPNLSLTHNLRDSSYVYQPGVTRIVEARVRTYFLKSDSATDTFQLAKYDGDDGADVPVVDHVVGLSFDYLGDPQPPRMRTSLAEGSGPWTTYGPAPPFPGAQTSLYPPGENCLFVSDGSPLPAPRLATLGSGTLVRLDTAQLSDGPWCPDAADPNRYDADLLRIRSVEVAVRVESSTAAFRGQVGPLFVRPGQSPGGRRFLPDQSVTFDVTPRNLAPGR